MQLFAELSVLVAIATIVSIAMRLLKQPLIIGHILTGLIAGPFILQTFPSVQTFTLFGEIGIAILLFTVGFNLSPSVIREFGKVSLITGIGQVVFTSLAGYVVCISLGFSPMTSLYLSVALAFSSTIIILKLITDKGDLETLYAKISIGFLLVQDLIVILLLFMIPLLSSGQTSSLAIALMLLKGAVLIAGTFLVSHKILPRLNKFLSGSQELLLLFAIAWGIGIAALFRYAGFPLESGALIAGAGLSTLPSRHEINSRLTPLRDFFILLFFILLGAQMQFGDTVALLPAALALSALVLIGNPLILMILMGAMGFRKKTTLQTGFTVGQISEFSLILIALGVRLNHLDPSILSLTTMVGLITIFGSTYLILYSDKIYDKIHPFLRVFERKVIREKLVAKEAYSAILFGCNRIGYDFLETFRKQYKKFLVVDHDPDIIEKLDKMGINTEYGDAGDLDFLESLDLSDLRLVVCTIPDPETSELICREVKHRNRNTFMVSVVHRIKDALDLYRLKVDYVILPHFQGGQFSSDLISKMKNDPKKFAALRKEQLRYLRHRAALGHEHPVLDFRMRV